ncbi:hypothetical protein CFC21_042669 [Triticum aestivum]|uniref:Deltamethrin resistance protein prag01 domain-containing protein n=3 Tax=Triticum TaxID=4564 RepID=A0A9R1FLX1_WHEAT|nr:uncharacterized protein LOC119277388 [Triticum dicoccoides]XP_044350646.1 uncharacterized protein LOC123071198 [Triticum aestivum]KAF7031326.1 hypothetical protein CFC21_042669 [Triticum aestivum]CDM84738.1 unnamed protein product [Triticum aestivum]VAH81184.1 unnamed protein product [Triticum turgidum subsp. durum]
MASALRFAARKMCSRVLQRAPHPYLSASASAAVKEGQRRIGHAGSSLRRFCSSGSPNLVNNTKHGVQSAAESASFISNAEYTPWWSDNHPKFLRNIFLYTVAVSTGSVATLYAVARIHGGPLFREALGLEPNPSNKDDRQSD